MRILAQFISWVFMPLFMPLYALGIALYVPSNQDYIFNVDCLYTLPDQGKWGLLSIFFIFCTALPGISFILLQRWGAIETIEMETRKERGLPILIMFAYCVALYALFIIKLGPGTISKFALALPLSGAIVTGLFYFLNRWRKVSIHAAGVGILTGFIFAYVAQHLQYEFWVLAFVVIVSGLVMSARLYLEKHSLLEMVVGWFTGTLITFAVNYFY